MARRSASELLPLAGGLRVVEIAEQPLAVDRSEGLDFDQLGRDDEAAVGERDP